jgi:hypothetical protein
MVVALCPLCTFPANHAKMAASTARPQKRAGDQVIFWLWDAPGTTTSTCGVSSDQADAREAAGTCVASGSAAVATVQAATLVSNPDAADPHYARFGPTWQATRTRNGEIRWRELAATAAS